ncbi:MAG: tRNA (uridine(34)/cytosine(34)/5-carboxymethylaminomethyluridine(34)-2'-O)-methyltransferase TrmL [Verrucomicrobia bacterium 21-51-4]|nr:MAG: tRNA (uridine(34)/cytosine(34)/5-carboxymethylaminomethyluridine(34)-2'-O)-methyltransferase TrmL [Verrucomicrobia bacterium 21-51-4]HQU09145.1 tRNA (cytidine(34)-2'-O)-methyltransferase [Opitutales bacterium]
MPTQPALHIVLYCPQIAPNTGNIGRLCAITGARLHLIHPLGFTIDDRHLRRSGMDYWYHLDIVEHAHWDAFWQSPQRPQRLWLLTTKATQSHWDAQYMPGDGLLFGNEGHGAPEHVHAAIGEPFRITIPQFNPLLRSLNLSTAAGIAAYEVLRQLSGAGLPLE